jgi:hypoxanthine phosphoribosyltransferase
MSKPGRVLLTESQLQQGVADMARTISRDYKGLSLTAIAILKGSFIFVADLIRQIDPAIPIEVDFITVASYHGATSSSGEMRILKDIDVPVEGKDVLIVEDIVDSGLTIARVRELLASRSPRSLRIAALLEKPGGRRHDAILDYVGFQIPDEFVVGYGLDHAERYRNLRDILRLDKDILSEDRITTH